MEPPWDAGMKNCSTVPGHMTKMTSKKTLNNLLLRKQEADDLETLYTASVLTYSPICSNDDTGLTLTIFMT